MAGAQHARIVERPAGNLKRQRQLVLGKAAQQ
jgi:hypothetical protein